MEFLCQVNQASLFAFATHSKKRPHSLILGRTFDDHVLDFVEFAVENMKQLRDFKVAKITAGIKPILLFSGERFETEHEYKRIKNLLLDFFRATQTDAIRLSGLEHVIQFVEAEGKIHLRSYKCLLKKSGTRLPRVELEEIGPRVDLTVRRSHMASDDLFNRACKQPRQLVKRKVKNVEKSALGSTLGRIHMERQDYSKLQTRKLKGLKRGKSDNS